MILIICANPSIDTYIQFDHFSPGKTNRTVKESKYPGGKGIHVALALRELEEEVVLLAFWGGDNGKWLKKKCTEVGIKCIGPRLKEPNRICYTFKTKDNFNATEILGKGPVIKTSVYEKFINKFIDILPQTGIIAISGSLPLDCPPDLYHKLQNIAAKNNKPLFIDCTGEPLRLAISDYCEGIHLNNKEFNELYPANNPGDAAKMLSAKSRYAAITDGKEGLYLASDKILIHAFLYLEKVYSAVGSGDCLLAGLIAAYRRGYSLSEMARLGVACGAAKCMNDELGLMHIKDVIELLPRVNIKEFQF